MMTKIYSPSLLLSGLFFSSVDIDLFKKTTPASVRSASDGAIDIKEEASSSV